MNHKMIKKCAYCKDEIIIDKPLIRDVIHYENAYYHKDCFIKMCTEKMNNKRCKIEKWKSNLDNIGIIEFNSKEYIKDVWYKDAIYRFMVDTYNVKIIPNNIFTKLDAIYSGTFKGMNVSISPEELLDMWIRQKKYLVKVHEKNLKLGKDMTESQKINYDISVLIGKYDSYLKWKNEQKVLAASSEQAALELVQNKDNKEYFTKIQKNQKDNKSNELDGIENILSEIFD